MQITHPLAAAALFAVAGIALAHETEPPVAVNLEGVPRQMRERIAQKAQEGETALIRYLARTRHMHNLRPEEIIKARKDETRVAERGDAPKP
jgi:hypothetical protein